MYSGKIFRTVPGRLPDVERKVFKIAFTREFSLTIWEKCFSAFARIVLAICQQKGCCQSLRNFNSRSRSNILVKFSRYEQRFFGFWKQVFGSFARICFHVSRGSFWYEKLADLRGKCSAVFSKTAIYIKWRTLPGKIVGVQPKNFWILRENFPALSSKL